MSRTEGIDKVSDTLSEWEIERRQHEAAVREKHVAIENRRFAVDAAIRFLNRDATHVKDGAAVLLCAETFRRYVDDGTMPDITESVKVMHDWAWHLVRGLYPESEIQRAMQQKLAAQADEPVQS